MIAPEAGLSVSRQCALLGMARSSFYYRPRPEAAEELDILKRLDRIFASDPVYGSRRLQVALLREGISSSGGCRGQGALPRPQSRRCGLFGSGTKGSNPLSSSRESGANLTPLPGAPAPWRSSQ
jgi:putative transposase